jgi:hypothetical protein
MDPLNRTPARPFELLRGYYGTPSDGTPLDSDPHKPPVPSRFVREWTPPSAEFARSSADHAPNDDTNNAQYWSPGNARHVGKSEHFKRVQLDIALCEAKLRILRAELEVIEKEEQ